MRYGTCTVPLSQEWVNSLHKRPVSACGQSARKQPRRLEFIWCGCSPPISFR